MATASAAASAALAWFMGLTGVYFVVALLLMVLQVVFFCYGVARAFRANVLLGIVVFFLPPVAFVIGLVFALAGRDLAEWFVNLLSGNSNP